MEITVAKPKGTMQLIDNLGLKKNLIIYRVLYILFSVVAMILIAVYLIDLTQTRMLVLGMIFLLMAFFLHLEEKFSAVRMEIRIYGNQKEAYNDEQDNPQYKFE